MARHHKHMNKHTQNHTGSSRLSGGCRLLRIHKCCVISICIDLKFSCQSSILRSISLCAHLHLHECTYTNTATRMQLHEYTYTNTPARMQQHVHPLN